MTILTFHGRIAFGDSYRTKENDDDNGRVFIGNVDILRAIDEAGFENPVTFAIADARYTGPLNYELGWGYSEYTPEEADRLTVGPHNIIDILERYNDDDEITVWIADEPFNRIPGEEVPENPDDETTPGETAGNGGMQ